MSSSYCSSSNDNDNNCNSTIVGRVGRHEIIKISIANNNNNNRSSSGGRGGKQQRRRIKLGFVLKSSEWRNQELQKDFPKSGAECAYVSEIKSGGLAEQAGVFVHDVICSYIGDNNNINSSTAATTTASSSSSSDNNNNDYTPDDNWSLMSSSDFELLVGRSEYEQHEFSFHVARKISASVATGTGTGSRRGGSSSSLVNNSNNNGNNRKGVTTLGYEISIRAREYQRLTIQEREELLQDAKKDAKMNFEKERDSILENLPDTVKEMFWQIGFAQWGRQKSKTFLPVLIISPYGVRPGRARDAWMNKYQQRKEKSTLDKMNHLVYWLGEPISDNCFSVITQESFVPWEQAKARKLHAIPNKCTKNRLAGLKAIHAASPRTPQERQQLLLPIVQEFHDLMCEDDLIFQDGDDDDDAASSTLQEVAASTAATTKTTTTTTALQEVAASTAATTKTTTTTTALQEVAASTAATTKTTTTTTNRQVIKRRRLTLPTRNNQQQEGEGKQQQQQQQQVAKRRRVLGNGSRASSASPLMMKKSGTIATSASAAVRPEAVASSPLIRSPLRRKDSSSGSRTSTTTTTTTPLTKHRRSSSGGSSSSSSSSAASAIVASPSNSDSDSDTIANNNNEGRAAQQVSDNDDGGSSSLGGGDEDRKPAPPTKTTVTTTTTTTTGEPTAAAAASSTTTTVCKSTTTTTTANSVHHQSVQGVLDTFCNNIQQISRLNAVLKSRNKELQNNVKIWKDQYVSLGGVFDAAVSGSNDDSSLQESSAEDGNDEDADLLASVQGYSTPGEINYLESMHTLVGKILKQNTFLEQQNARLEAKGGEWRTRVTSMVDDLKKKSKN